MRNQRHLRLLVIGMGISLLCLGLAPAGASSANISHSYHAATPVPNGSLVSLDPQKSDYVVSSNSDNASRLLGVAVATNDSLLAVDPDQGTVQVATNGTASALVSTLNGTINVGDQIAVSPFNGIGVKASPGSKIIGLAQTSFDGTSSGAIQEKVTDNAGKARDISVGYVRLSIGVGTNVDAASGDQQLNSLQKLAKSITGHVVSTARVVISLVVALVAIISLIVLMYASIYGSIISIGRNPLAKYAVFRTLGSVLGMAVLTAVIASLIIFFLLR